MSASFLPIDGVPITSFSNQYRNKEKVQHNSVLVKDDYYMPLAMHPIEAFLNPSRTLSANYAYMHM